ncbi:MAG TPA: hypothetical protein VMV78_07540 [Thiobacillus sp.]|jgi:hypothetical protein|nr:hypothetical protein [Thiobacillus sp.]
METRDLPRHQLIERLMAQHPEKLADAAIDLWERMAAQIISIMGEDGFNSLYARSVFLAQPTFPWLTTSSLPQQTDQRFTELKKGLEGQTPSQAREANSLLLLTFTGILAALIGEPLTTRILGSAWGDDASTSISKEFKHE